MDLDQSFYMQLDLCLSLSLFLSLGDVEIILLLLPPPISIRFVYALWVPARDEENMNALPFYAVSASRFSFSNATQWS